MQICHWFGIFHHARVVVVHAVDVSPNLDFFGAYGRTDERSGIVASAALQVVDFAVSVTTNKSLRNVYFVSAFLFQYLVDILFDESRIRFVVLVNLHKVEGGNQE